MAGAASKKRQKENSGIIQRHAIITLVVQLIYSIYRVYFEWDSFTFWNQVWFFGVVATYAISLKLLVDYAKPFSGGDVLSLKEIPKGSLTEYIFDVLYVLWFTQLVSMFTSYVWYILVIIPVFAIYRLWTGIIGPMLSQRKAMASLAEMGDDEDDSSGYSNRQLKLKAREEKQQARMRKSERS